MPVPKLKNQPSTLTDRIGVALLSGLTAFITGTLIWVLLIFSVGRFAVHESSFEALMPSFQWVLYFTAFLALIGFATLLNLMANIFGSIWSFLYKTIRIWF